MPESQRRRHMIMSDDQPEAMNEETSDNSKIIYVSAIN